MTSGITPIVPLTPVTSIETPGSPGKKVEDKPGSEFSSFLNEAITNLESAQQEAGTASAALAAGEIEDFHTPVIAMEKANLALNLAVTVRNKVLDAYQEIMRMQI